MRLVTVTTFALQMGQKRPFFRRQHARLFGRPKIPQIHESKGEIPISSVIGDPSTVGFEPLHSPFFFKHLANRPLAVSSGWVVAAAGTTYSLNERQLRDIITLAGFVPSRRDYYYRLQTEL